MKLWMRLSFVLNALLLGLVVWLEAASPRSVMIAAAPSPQARPGLLPDPNSMLPLREGELLPEVVEMDKPFRWAQIESSDYSVFLANLRALRCPEATVRDILVADVNDLFAARVKALVDEVNSRFWELIVRKDDFEKMVSEKHDQLRALDGERDKIITALFNGNDPRSIENEERCAAEKRDQWESVADFLTEEKRGWFVEMNEKHDRTWEEYLRTPGLSEDQRQAKRKELNDAREKSLIEGLSPGEYEELRLRQSSSAILRERLVALNLSEDETRTLAKIQYEKEEAQKALSQKNADYKARMDQMRQQAEAKTLELVGAEGYAALQRAEDGRYNPIYRVTQRLELPDSAAAQAYDIRRQSEDAVRQLRNDRTLSDEDRQARLEAVHAAAKQSLSATLGPKGFSAYDKIDGGWMNQMIAP